MADKAMTRLVRQAETLKRIERKLKDNPNHPNKAGLKRHADELRENLSGIQEAAKALEGIVIEVPTGDMSVTGGKAKAKGGRR